jgi:hypothetical protein
VKKFHSAEAAVLVLPVVGVIDHVAHHATVAQDAMEVLKEVFNLRLRHMLEHRSGDHDIETLLGTCFRIPRHHIVVWERSIQAGKQFCHWTIQHLGDVLHPPCHNCPGAGEGVLVLKPCNVR